MAGPVDGRAMGLRAVVERAVAERPVAAILLSGGIDSSLLAALDRRPVAVTVAIEGGESNTKPRPGAGCRRCRRAALYPPGCGQDLRSAEAVAVHLGLDWHPVVLDHRQAFAVLEELVRLFRSYDLGLLNDIPLYAGLREAKALGMRSACTGEDADTLFGGYVHHHHVVDWPGYLARAIPQISPPSEPIGEALGVEVRYPYLHPAVLAFARSLAAREVVDRRVDAGPGAFMDQFDRRLMRRRAKPWGKLVLRRAAGGLLPDHVAWRPKTDLEFGSGTCRLEQALAASVTPSLRVRLARRRLRFFGDAHRGLRLLFERLGLEVEPPAAGQYPCRWCGAGVNADRLHCRTCGAFPAQGDGGG